MVNGTRALAMTSFFALAARSLLETERAADETSEIIEALRFNKPSLLFLNLVVLIDCLSVL